MAKSKTSASATPRTAATGTTGTAASGNAGTEASEPQTESQEPYPITFSIKVDGEREMLKAGDQSTGEEGGIAEPTPLKPGMHVQFSLFEDEEPVKVEVGAEEPHEVEHMVDEEFVRRFADQRFINFNICEEDGEVCHTVPISILPLITKKLEVGESLSNLNPPESPLRTPAGLDNLTIVIKLSSPLLQPWLSEKLNPMSVTVVSANELPGYPVQHPTRDALTDSQMHFEYPRLAEYYDDPYVRYKLFGDEFLETPRAKHAPTIRWDDTRMFFVGTMDQNELIHKFETENMEFEVHDRDRVDFEARRLAEEEAERLAQEEQERQKEAALTARSNKSAKSAKSEKSAKSAASSASKETKQTKATADGSDKKSVPSGGDIAEEEVGEEEEVKKTPNQYGTVSVTLRELVRSEKRVKVISSVVPARVDKIYVPGGEFEYNCPIGSFTEAGTSLTVRVELCHNIGEGDYAGKFSRATMQMKYDNIDLFMKIVTAFNQHNSFALGLENAPASALSTYQLSPEQRSDSSDLDILTGFQVLDQDYRMIVVEGLAGKGIEALYNTVRRLEHNNKDSKVLYNPDITFKERLYPAFDVQLKSVKLRQPLRTLMNQFSLYSNSAKTVAPECYEALKRIYELRKLTLVNQMREAQRMDLFPRDNMIFALDKKFGEVLTVLDVGGTDKRSKKQYNLMASKLKQAPPMTEDERVVTFQRPARKAKIDYQNPGFLSSIQHRSTVDHVKKNILAHTSEKKAEKNYAQDAEGDIFIYSGQKLQYTNWQMEQMRRELAKDKGAMYTYSRTFQSQSFPLVNEWEVARDEEVASRKKDTTSEGWIYPRPRSPRQYTLHPHKPSQSRIDDLQEPWKENELRPKPVTRDGEREAAGKPHFVTHFEGIQTFSEESFFKTVHTEGSMEKQDLQRKEIEGWRNKVVVDDLVFHTVGTRGAHMRTKPSQLNRTDPILKDAPKKKALKDLKKTNFDGSERMPYSVFSQDKYVEAMDFVKTLGKSDDPRHFVDQKGKNFANVFNRERDMLGWKPNTVRHIQPLKESEKVGGRWGRPTSREG